MLSFPYKARRSLSAMALGASLALFSSDRASAQTPAPPAEAVDVKALLERMDRLEKQNSDLQKQLQEQQNVLHQNGAPALPPAAVPAVDETTVKKIVDDYLQQNPAKVISPDAPSCGADGESKTENIQTREGLLSRGVWETSIERRILGPGKEAGWDQGAFLKSFDASDGYLRIGSDLEVDFRGFPDKDDGKDVSSFLVRRARINLDGIFATYFDYRLMMDFSQKQSNTSDQAITIIQDAWVNVHYWDEFQLEIGKFKSPIGFEQLIQDRATPFIERSMFDQLLPARDIGIMAHGEMLFCDRLDWAVNIANGEVQNLDYDTDNKKDIIGRVAVRPFNGSWYIEGLSRLQFTYEASVGVEHENLSANAAGGSGFTVRTPATVPWLVFNNSTTNAVQEDGPRTRLAPSASYFYGGLGMAGQYYFEEQQLQQNPSGTAAKVVYGVPLTGYDIFFTYILTGETRNSYTQPLKIIRPFEPWHLCQGYGAIEVGARLSRVGYDPVIFEPFNIGTAKAPVLVRFANPTGNSSGATELTVGINWFWNRYFKIQLNYEHDFFDQPVQLGPLPKNLLKYDDALLARFALVY
jgi:phosphate-selective porin OprO/OprP